VFSIQDKESGDSFAACHVKNIEMRANLRDEASLLYQVRNAKELIQLQGNDFEKQKKLILDSPDKIRKYQIENRLWQLPLPTLFKT
jgi:hypothetical protein